MKLINKWMNVNVIALLSIVFFSLLFPKPQSAQSSLPNPIVFGSDSNFPPYEFLDKNGKPAGFNIDLLQAIADEMGFNIEFRLGIWAKIKNEFEEQETIHISDMFYSAERNKKFDYAIPHEVTYDKIYVQKNNKEIFSISDLTNKKVAVYMSSTLEEYLNKNHPKINLISVPSEQDALILLSEGNCDAAIVSDIIQNEVITNLKKDNLIVIGRPTFPREFSFVVKKGNDKLLRLINGGLVSLKENGKFNELKEKWFFEQKQSWISNNLVLILSILVGIVILFVIINISLRVLVKRKTKELEFVNSRLKLISNVKAARIDKYSAQEQIAELLNYIKDTFLVDACIVRIIEGNELKLWGSVGIKKKNLIDSFAINEGVGGKIISAKKAIRIKNISVEKSQADAAKLYPNFYEFVSYAGAPLLIEDKVIGIIGIYSEKTEHEFSEIDIEHLQIVANQIAISIENSTLFEQNIKQKELLIEQILSRKKAEETLNVSEEKFKLAFQTSPDSINITKFDGTYVDINEGFTALSGFTKEDVIGKTSTELNIWVDTKDRDKLVKQLKAEGRYSNLEAKFRMKNGDIIFGLMSAAVISLNNVKHILTITRNITDIVNAQEKLKESEARFRTAFENSGVGMCLVSMDGKFLQVNAKLCLILGYHAPELLTLNFNKITHPDDISISNNFTISLFKNQNESINFEKRYLKKNGDKIWAEVSSSLIRSENNEPLYFIAQIIDITDRKLALLKVREKEIQFRKLSTHVPDLIFQFTRNADGKYFVPIASNGIINIFGCKPEDVVNDFTAIAKVIHPDDMKRVFETIEYSAANLSPFECEFRVILPEKGVRWILSRSTPEPLEDGSVTWYGFNTNTTERKLTIDEIKKLNETLEQKVIERTAQLEATNKELESFAYSVSHDLRAPLRSIDGFSQAILEDYYDKLDELGKNFLNRIRASAQMMAKLIDDMLSLSRVTRNPMKLAKVDLSEIVESISNDLINSDKNRKAKFIISKGLVNIADSTLISSVIQNLIENAWKFSSKKNESIIEFGIVDINKKSAYFIKDNGAGFDIKYANKLFSPFQRLHQQTEFSGTGIGLATVQRIIYRHNGEVWAEGKVGEGAIFYFTLNIQNEEYF